MSRSEERCVSAAMTLLCTLSEACLTCLTRPLTAALLAGLLALSLLTALLHARKGSGPDRAGPEGLQPQGRGTLLPPGSLGLPVIGEMIQFVLQAATGEFFTRRESKYGPIFKTHILFHPTIYISGREAVKKVTLGEHTLVENAWPRSMQALLGPGALAASSAHAHKQRKQTVVRCFRRELLQEYLPMVDAIIRTELDRWMSAGRVELYSSAQRMTIRAAAKVMLGLEGPGIDNIEGDILQYAGGFFSVPAAIPGTAFYWATAAKERLHKVLAPMLRDKYLNPPCAHSAPHRDVISSLYKSSLASMSSPAQQPDLKSACDHTIEEVCTHAINQSLELLFGGQGTLAGVVTCLVTLLAENSAVVARMQEELEENGLMEGEGVVDLETLDRLQYVWNVVRETLRLYPPVGGGYRRALKTFEVEGYQIPQGWTITYSIKSTHDSSPLYAHKDKFDPARWDSLDTDSAMTHFDFMPFGAGARACVGREYAKLFSRLFCVNLVRTCRWELTSSETPVMLRVPIIRPQNELYVNVTARSDSSL